MQLGLFLRRAMITLARSGKVFPDRVAAVILALAIVAGCVLFWDRFGWDRTSIGGSAWFGHSTFGMLVLIQTLLGMALCGQVAPSIASERDGKSLDSLLASRLSTAEIVLGTFATGLIRSAHWLAAALPVLILVAIAAGVRPLLVLSSAAGLASSVLVAAALTVTVSVYAPNRSRARSAGMGAFLAWVELPVMVEFILPLAWRGAPRWFVQALRWLVDSSPAGVGTSAFLPTLVPRPFGLVEALVRMITLQLAASVVLLLWSAWQLRPASRALHDGEWPASIRWLWRLTRQRPRQRHPCADDPVLWNELHSQRVRSHAGRLLASLVSLAGIGLLALGASWFARPAIAELAERGYGASTKVGTMPEVDPLARVLISKLFFPTGSAAPGQARLEFNIALRQFSAIFVMLYVVMVAGTAASSIIVEYERNTWQSLIATSLTGWDILRAKMLAAIWRARGVGLALLALWTVGLLTGALHPLGYAIASLGLLAIGAFYAALGVLVSLHIGERKRIDHAMILFVLGVLPFSGLAILLPGTASMLLGACSSPFLIWSSLFSYEDVRALAHSGVLPQLGDTSIKPGVGARMVLLACSIAVIVHALGAFLLTRWSCRNFDSMVGRPHRSGKKAARPAGEKARVERFPQEARSGPFYPAPTQRPRKGTKNRPAP